MGKILIIKNANFVENAIVNIRYANITVSSVNDEYGTVTGSGKYLIGDTVIISAISNSGYHFVSWDDGNTSSIRSIIVSPNKTSYIATFESGEMVDIYGDETLYENQGGYSSTTYGQKSTINTPALHAGQLKSIRMSLSQNFNANILCGIVDQNGYFILSRRYENVPIKGREETDLSNYNITVYEGEIVAVAKASDEDAEIAYAYYSMGTAGTSNMYAILGNESIYHRSDGVYQTFYYKIRY